MMSRYCFPTVSVDLDDLEGGELETSSLESLVSPTSNPAPLLGRPATGLTFAV